MPVLRRPSHEILIRPKWSRSRRFSYIGGAVVGVLAVTMLAWYGGMRAANRATEADLQRLAQLETAATISTEQISILKQNLATAERAMQISRTAYAELDLALAANEGELEVIKSDLGFYQSIISPRDGSVGLRIYDLQVPPSDGPRTEFTLTLIQSIRHDRDAEGEVHIEAWGEGLEQPVSRWPASGGRQFSFRYFEKLEGSVDIPEDVIEPRLMVVVTPGEKGSTPITHWYPQHDQAITSLSEIIE